MRYLRAKRSNLLHEFFASAADAIGAPGGKTVEDMCKNLGKDYKKLLVKEGHL
jgi:hypothetical protein